MMANSTIANCYCCERRGDTDPCACSTGYCGACISCSTHYRCRDPMPLEDDVYDGGSDVPFVIDGK